ncbi:helix-turn-helix domain-containing protein [Arthrobacter sp. C152]
MTEGNNSAEWVHVGGRLRAARKDLRLSLRELAKRVGVSASHLSQVERGLASLSVPVLYAVVGELHLSMDSLFEDRSTTKATSAGLPGNVHRESGLDAAGIVQRYGNRPMITLPDGKKWQRLTSAPLKDAEFLEIIYDPSDAPEDDAGLLRHLGHEYGLVLEGELTVQLGFDQAQLRAGDSIHFDSTIPHRFWNCSSQRTRAIWFIVWGEGGNLGDHLGDTAHTATESPFTQASSTGTGNGQVRPVD